MVEEEWMDLHHYFPANKLENEKEKNNDELWEPKDQFQVLTWSIRYVAIR